MPNIHADHIETVTDKCPEGSPYVRICRFQLWSERLMIAVIFAVLGIAIGSLTK